MTKYSKVVG